LPWRQHGKAVSMIGGAERFPVRWNRMRFHLTGNARTGVSCCSRHIPFG
jgi:hypothetical protein